MERRKILIATKTYPSISKKYRETVCTARVLLNGTEQPIQWVRIYPIRSRQLDFDKRYPTKQPIISAKIEINAKDFHFQSYRIDDSSIEIVKQIETKNNLADRKELFLPLQSKFIKDLSVRYLSLALPVICSILSINTCLHSGKQQRTLLRSASLTLASVVKLR